MPLPAIPFIAGFIGSFLASITSAFLKIMSLRAAASLAFIAGLIVLLGTFSGLAFGLVSVLTYVAPPYLADGVALFLPSNYSICFGIVMSVKVLSWVWYWNYQTFQKIVNPSSPTSFVN